MQQEQGSRTHQNCSLPETKSVPVLIFIIHNNYVHLVYHGLDKIILSAERVLFSNQATVLVVSGILTKLVFRFEAVLKLLVALNCLIISLMPRIQKTIMYIYSDFHDIFCVQASSILYMVQ